MGIVYLIQPTEFARTDVYKVGCSLKDALTRINTGYHKGTAPLLVEHVDDPAEVEKLIVRCFAERFVCRMGREYFEGDVEAMMRCFKTITTKLQDDKRKGAGVVTNNVSVQEQPFHRVPEIQVNPLQCNRCGKTFSRMQRLRGHQEKCDGLDVKQCKICLKIFATTHGRYNHNKNVKCSPPPTPSVVSALERFKFDF